MTTQYTMKLQNLIVSSCIICSYKSIV